MPDLERALTAGKFETPTSICRSIVAYLEVASTLLAEQSRDEFTCE